MVLALSDYEPDPDDLEDLEAYIGVKPGVLQRFFESSTGSDDLAPGFHVKQLQRLWENATYIQPLNRSNTIALAFIGLGLVASKILAKASGQDVLLTTNILQHITNIGLAGAVYGVHTLSSEFFSVRHNLDMAYNNVIQHLADEDFESGRRPAFRGIAQKERFPGQRPS